MPPLRRYLRVTPRTVLEVRIYLDDPRDLHRWLLNPTAPALPTVIESVRLYVLPKLREENDAAQGKGKKGGAKPGRGKKGGVKDVVKTDDFEASIFLTQTSARHSILQKRKHIKPDPSTTTPHSVRRRQITLTQLGSHADDALDVDATPPPASPPPFLNQEDDEDGDEEMSNIPFAGRENTIDVDDWQGEEMQQDEKKKMPMNTSYGGFAIYGRILCLVVKRVKRVQQVGEGAGGGMMMEEWIGTQVAREGEGVVSGD